MDPLITALLGASVALLIAAGAYLFASGARALSTKEEVIVVLRSGETLKGVLIHRWPTTLELASASLLSGSESQTRIDGTVQVDRRNVVWIQVT